ncbi:zinc finger protein with KRAB and SCAN domains 5-like isoform X2 [Hoplias malabaricus]|uniref:zinc finger protein with KRAB and SCAN domains 5-like isoform X2 n=1 Tax=Hoplias malabaricus TaxID=27720 RepID=UPI003461C94E
MQFSKSFTQKRPIARVLRAPERCVMQETTHSHAAIGFWSSQAPKSRGARAMSDLPLTSCTDEQNSSQDPLDSESSPGHLTTMWQGEGDEPQSALNSASTSISPGKKSVCGNQTFHADPQEPPHFSQDPLDPKPSFIQVKVELSTMNQEAELQEPLPDSSASPSPSGRESPCLLSGNTIKGEKTDNDLHNTGATIKVEPQDIDCENTPPPGIQREDGQDLRDDEGNSYFRSKMPLDHVSPAETRPQKQTEVFFRCKYCGKFVASRGRLKQHLVVHQKSRPRPYRCDLCGKSYSYAYVLENHHRTHTGERPYHCRFCGKCFKQKGHLSSHEKIHTGERPYGCLICGKRFIQSCQVKRHVRNHHQDKKQFL